MGEKLPLRMYSKFSHKCSLRHIQGCTIILIFTAGKTPEMSELNKYLIKYCGLWRAIGLKLGLKDDLLDVIENENSKQHKECFRIMLQKWLIQDVQPTWNTLELAITNAQRDDLSLDNLSESMLPLLCFYVYPQC